MKIIACVLLLCFIVLGTNARNIQKRISGGDPVETGTYRHHALFALDGKVECSGALISNYHVLLAAHCFLKIFGKLSVIMAVFVGSMIPFVGQSHSIKKISYFKDYSTDFKMRFHHDIGMIHLENPATSAYIAPIELPKRNADVEKRTSVSVTGFGKSDDNQPHSRRLLRLKTKTLSLTECKPYFPEGVIDNSNICTWQRPGLGCNTGDGGAPLVDASAKTILGVLAGTSHSPNGEPDVYTKVSHYIEYIEEEMQLKRGNVGHSTRHPAIYFTRSKAQPFPGENSGPMPLHYEHHVLA